ncbi:MAG TPA: DUF4384 domain-containing protein [Syntrophales bacterium]|nr:DUF4384 domain-containing protein [Syntrophales bacterium]
MKNRSDIFRREKQTPFWRWAPLVAMCLLVTAVAEDRVWAEAVKVVVTEGRAVMGEDMTLAQTRALALGDARRRAVEQSSGVMIRGVSVVYDARLIGDVITALTRGLIVGEEILEEGLKREGEAPVYICRLKARVQVLDPGRERFMTSLRAEIAGPDGPLSSSRAVFRDGEEMVIRIRGDKSFYPHIFSVDQDGRVAELLPHPLVRWDLVPAGREVLFPTEDLRKAGFRLRVRAPAGLSRAYETIVVIATKEAVPILDRIGREATITDLMGALASRDHYGWVETLIGYEVRR